MDRGPRITARGEMGPDPSVERPSWGAVRRGRIQCDRPAVWMYPLPDRQYRSRFLQENDHAQISRTDDDLVHGRDLLLPLPRPDVETPEAPSAPRRSAD